MRARALAAAAFAGALASAAAADAHAFCRTTTKAIDPTFVPTPDEPCWTEGLPLYWANACIGYSIQQDASKQISFNDVQAAMDTAFARWTNAACPSGGAAPKPSIEVRYLGPVACHTVQYNQQSGNANIVMFDDSSWPHPNAIDTLGLTTVTYNPNTGELYDADMEVNTAEQQLTVTQDTTIPSDGFDFASIVTHEAGHFLGLAHSQDPKATMFAHYTQGTTSLRNLSMDDVQGICAAYPPDGTRNTADGGLPAGACDPTPRHGYSGDCGSGSGGGGGGCAAGGGGAAGDALAAALLAGLGLVLARRKSRA